jgi:glucokinase
MDTVGLSFPAPITSGGIVNQACTVWGDRGKNFPLLKKLMKACREVKWTIANDISAAAERYAAMDKYKNIDYFAVITVSSGIGSKIYDVKNRKVLLDRRSIGGEIGHVKVDFSSDAAVCDCGGKGHLAAISSGRAVERIAISEAKRNSTNFKKSLLFKLVQDAELINNLHLVNALKINDSFTIRILDKATFPLACSIAQISGGIGADKFIFIGGFALSCGDKYLDSLKRNLQKIDFYSREKKDILNLVDLGINDDSDSLIGAGILASKQHFANARQ